MNPTSMPVVDIEDMVNEYDDSQWIPAPCQRACPVGTDVASYVTLIWEEKYMEAAQVITATNPFASICAQACVMPCEGACRRAEIGDKAVTIRALKRFVMDRVGDRLKLPPVPVSRPQTIAIVGAGPTGLTAAQDLARMGYAVDVYEKSDRPGGMMNLIPEWRLPRQAIEADIKRILEGCPGIRLHLSCPLGEKIDLEDLKARHDAVLLTIGQSTDRRLGIPGETDGLAGLFGIGLLDDLSRGQATTLSGRVAIVGGGNVAMDVARTALRLGADSADLYCLESRDQMPASPHEIQQAEAEGVTIHAGWGPKQILSQNGQVTGVEWMRCTSVFDDTGRFNPSYDRQDTHSDAADAVLVAIGLMAQSDALKQAGLLAGGRIRCDQASLQTAESKVFAAGDGAFGPSSVVAAMAQGHKAAYYIQAFIEGKQAPAAYQTPFYTRQLPIPQDSRWEKLEREDQPFHGIDNTCSYPRLSPCESAFDPETARRQAARCFRCDAETGTAGYQRRDREHLRLMSQTTVDDNGQHLSMLLERLRPRDNPFADNRPAQLDDMHFLPAGMTRLVIDPYREACETRTRIGRIEFELPYLVTGFDGADADIRQALAQSLAANGCGYIGATPLVPNDAPALEDEKRNRPPWFQLLSAENDVPSQEAAALIYVSAAPFAPVAAERQAQDQLLGLAVKTDALEQAIPYALQEGFDLLVLDGTAGIDKPWSELDSYPDLTCLREAVRILRTHKSEGKLALIYYGGLRTGTDAAKVLAMTCNAGAFGVAAAIAMGGSVGVARMTFDTAMPVSERTLAMNRWIKATAQESMIIARSTGKTSVHNIEPEDLRAVTLKSAHTLGIPLAAGLELREDY